MNNKNPLRGFLLLYKENHSFMIGTQKSLLEVHIFMKKSLWKNKIYGAEFKISVITERKEKCV